VRPLTPEEIDTTDWAAEAKASDLALVEALHKIPPERRGELYEWVLASVKAGLPLEPDVPFVVPEKGAKS
jgi:hypothetical protein